MSFATKSVSSPTSLFIVHSSPGSQTSVLFSNPANMLLGYGLDLFFCLDYPSSLKYLYKWILTSDLLMRVSILGHSSKQQILCPTPLYSTSYPALFFSIIFMCIWYTVYLLMYVLIHLSLSFPTRI